MPRPVKWSRDLHPIRERARRSKTETWSRHDVEQLFEISRPSAQNLMKAIGEIQTVGAAHFIDRTSLLSFLDEMITADSVEEALRNRLALAEPPPKAKSLRVSLPQDLRSIKLRTLPAHIRLSPGHLSIDAPNAIAMAESLALLAQAMQNDMDGWIDTVSVREPILDARDEDLRALLANLRANKTENEDGHST